SVPPSTRSSVPSTSAGNWQAAAGSPRQRTVAASTPARCAPRVAIVPPLTHGGGKYPTRSGRLAVTLSLNAAKPSPARLDRPRDHRRRGGRGRGGLEVRRGARRARERGPRAP